MEFKRDYIRNMSLNQAENQLDGEALRKYRFAWGWSATRMGGSAGYRQERYYETHGRDHFWARINQVRRILGLYEYKISEA